MWRLRRPSSARGIHVVAPFWACEAPLAQPPHGAQLLISLAHPHNHGQLGLEPRHFSCSCRIDFALLASFCCFVCVYPQGGPGQLRRPEIAERGAPCPFRCSPRWQGRLAGRGEPRERGRTGGRPPCARSPPPTAPPPPTRKAGWRATGPATKGGSGTQSRHSAVPTRKVQTKAAAGRGVGSERGQGRGRSGRGCGGAAGAVPSDSDFRRVFTLRRPKHRRKATK